MAYLNQTRAEPERADYYMAQIAAEVRRTNVKNPATVRLKDFLLRTESSRGSRISRSKNFWLGSLGIKKGGDVDGV